MNGSKLSFPVPLAYQQEVFNLTEEDVSILYKKYNISDRVLKDSINLIKDWYNKQPHFPKSIELDDKMLIGCLANSKFSVEKTKTKLENLLTAKSLIPEFFSSRDTTDLGIITSLNTLDWILFPELTPEKYRVLYTRLTTSNADVYDSDFMYTVGFMMADMRLNMDAAHGDIYVWDFSNIAFGHVTKMPPVLIKKSAFVIQNCYGQRVKGIHVINVPPFAEFMFNLIKSFYSKKIASRMHVHKSIEDLYEHIPKSSFPCDMGGNGTQTSKELANTFKNAFFSPEWRQWFLDTQHFKTDESKRYSQNTIADVYGVSGSFRKLDID